MSRKTRNKNVWQRTKQKSITHTITFRNEGTCIGYILRKENTNITHHALEWNPHGHRKKGRPKNTWRRNLTSEAQKIGKTWGEIKKLAKDRENGKLQWSPYAPLGTKWIK